MLWQEQDEEKVPNALGEQEQKEVTREVYTDHG